MTAVRKVFVLAATGRQEAVASARRVGEALRAAGFEVVEELRADGQRVDCILLFGGDGFLMESLHLLDYPETPIFGVNFGTVGFLMNSHTCVDDIPSILGEGRYSCVEHRLLRANVTLESGEGLTCFAFNEFVLERQTGQAVRLRLSVDGTLFTRFAGDGFVLSTPAGSTAYNLAAHGPAVHPAVPGVVLTPLYPHQAEPFHSMQFSVVLPFGAEIELASEDVPKRHMRLVADGRPVEGVASVQVSDAGRAVRLLRSEGHDFLRRLAEKFIGARTE